MRGATAKRGTHGLRKRCPVCKKLRKFRMSAEGYAAHTIGRWTKRGGRWVCPRCSDRLDAERSALPSQVKDLNEVLEV